MTLPNATQVTETPYLVSLVHYPTINVLTSKLNPPKLGEHIDYSLFGVLPAAIENQMAIAIRATPSSNGSITVSNRDSDYTPATFSAIKDDKGEWDLAIDQKALRWESYVKAGYLVSELKLSLAFP